MQRTTTTTAALLVIVAVSALAGCVTVQRPPVPAPATAVPSRPPAPLPDGRAGTQVVQAPAREALERVGPSREPERPAPRRRQAPAAAPAERPPSSPSQGRRPPARPRPAHRAPHRSTAPYAEIPDVREEVRRDTDVCALGRKYGGWQGDSPQAAICERTYGR